jgi:hypothetical protein
VGLIFLTREGYHENVLKFKPNNKLSNFQSYGIPTIACGYQSFLEFGDEAFLKVDTLDEVFTALKKLTESYSLRKLLKDKGKENSKKFSLESISKLYKF